MTALTSNQSADSSVPPKICLHPFSQILLKVFRIPKDTTEILQTTVDELLHKLLQRTYTNPQQNH